MPRPSVHQESVTTKRHGVHVSFNYRMKKILLKDKLVLKKVLIENSFEKSKQKKQVYHLQVSMSSKGMAGFFSDTIL